MKLEIVTNDQFEDNLYREDVEKMAKESILQFFSDKKDFSRDLISQEELFSSFSLKTVIQSRFDGRTFDFIHEHCLPCVNPDPDWKQNFPWRQKHLLDLLEDMQSMALPKCFFPGLSLLYFKFCYGVEIIEPI